MKRMALVAAFFILLGILGVLGVLALTGCAHSQPRGCAFACSDGGLCALACP